MAQPYLCEVQHPKNLVWGEWTIQTNANVFLLTNQKNVIRGLLAIMLGK